MKEQMISRGTNERTRLRVRLSARGNFSIIEGEVMIGEDEGELEHESKGWLSTITWEQLRFCEVS
jgi:hypothetical protein